MASSFDFVHLHSYEMAPKSGNAFAQQKELQRQNQLETKPREGDAPGTPMTTMSMFIGPDVARVDNEGPIELKNHPNVDPLQKPATGRRKLGQRAFTDPLDLGATTTHLAGATEPSSFGKQSSGLDYIKSKFTGKSKKSKDSESSSQPSRKPAPSGHLSNTPSSVTMSNIRRIEAAPEAAPTMLEKISTQPLPSHLSTVTTRTVATPQSQYATLLKNDAMILGNTSMSPTRSGSYAMAGYPVVVSTSHPSIFSMTGSILEASSRDSSATVNPYTLFASSAKPNPYDTSFTAPLPPPPGEEFQEQVPFQQQLPFYLQLQPHERSDQTNFTSGLSHPAQHDKFNSGTWEQMHVQFPATTPQFSPINPRHLYRGDPDNQPGLARSSGHADDADELRKESLYNANASDTKSESGKETLKALEDAENAELNVTTPLRGSLRRCASDHELRYASYQVDSPNRTPVARKHDKPAAQLAKSFRVLSPSALLFRPSDHETSTIMEPFTLKPDVYEGDRSKQSEPAPGLLQNVSTPFYNGNPAQGPGQNLNEGPGQNLNEGPGQNLNEGSSAQSHGDETTRGGHPSTPQHPHYQARSTLEEQMAHQFNVMHHHMEAVKYTLTRCIEDAKNFLADILSSQNDENSMNQFRQLSIQTDGFRQYWERIHQQTTKFRQDMAADVIPAVSYGIPSQIDALEHRYREEFKRINNNMLTFNENVYSIQRNVSKQMTQLSRKMDLLLEAQGVDTSSGGHYPHKDRDTVQRKLRADVLRRQDELMKEAAMLEKENEAGTTAAPTASAASAASSPITQVSTPPTKTRKPAPLPANIPIMAAALTSTPPHVPQLPQALPQSSSVATVTITDPSIPSPSAVSNARRIRHGHAREQGEAWKENNRAGIVSKGLANATSIQEPGSHVHPALRYHEGIERLAAGKDKQQNTEKKEDDDNEVLWRKPSGDGEIGGMWYKAAMQQ